MVNDEENYRDIQIVTLVHNARTKKDIFNILDLVEKEERQRIITLIESTKTKGGFLCTEDIDKLIKQISGDR
jgi:hypothetical protein